MSRNVSPRPGSHEIRPLSDKDIEIERLHCEGLTNAQVAVAVGLKNKHDIAKRLEKIRDRRSLEKAREGLRRAG